MRHYSFILPILKDRGLPFPERVAELGPGNSVGTGIAALLAGAQSYVGLDIVNHLDTQRNLQILDELVDLFRKRTEIPCTGSFAKVFPLPEDSEFPSEIDQYLLQTLRSERIERIRESLRRNGKGVVRIVAPWTDSRNLEAESLDWLWSHSVMEHADAVEETYACMHKWLSPGGITSHLVDFWSHGLTSVWNGHWVIGDIMWTLMRGRRHYLLNRLSRSQHLKLLEETGFDILLEKRDMRHDGFDPRRFAKRFRNISEEDSQTRMSFIVARKPDRISASDS